MFGHHIVFSVLFILDVVPWCPTCSSSSMLVLSGLGIIILSLNSATPLLSVMKRFCALYSLHVSAHGSFSARFLISCLYSGSVSMASSSFPMVIALLDPGLSMPVAAASPAIITSFSSSSSFSDSSASGEMFSLLSSLCAMYRPPIIRPSIILAPFVSGVLVMACSITSSAFDLMNRPAPTSMVSTPSLWSFVRPTGALDPASAARFFVPGMCVSVKGWNISIFLPNSMSLWFITSLMSFCPLIMPSSGWWSTARCRSGWPIRKYLNLLKAQ